MTKLDLIQMLMCVLEMVGNITEKAENAFSLFSKAFLVGSHLNSGLFGITQYGVSWIQ